MPTTSLMFHDVVPEGRWESSGFPGTAANLYKLDCRDFRRHLEAIGRVPLPQRRTALDLFSNPEQDAVLLTFDDGGESALLHIADLLEEFSWKGHFLVTAGRVGTPGFLNASQIQQLHQRGHVIGSHSYSHPLRMSTCPRAELVQEWTRSVEVLSDILGSPVQVASVPGGGFSREVALTAAAAHIRVLFNSEPVTRAHQIGGCLILGRFGAKRSTPPDWSARIVANERGLRFREYALWNAKKLGKRLLGPAWLKARETLLREKS